LCFEAFVWRTLLIALSCASAHMRLVRACCGHGSRVRVRNVQQI